MDTAVAQVASTAVVVAGTRRVVLFDFDFDGVLVRCNAFTKLMRARYL